MVSFQIQVYQEHKQQYHTHGHSYNQTPIKKPAFSHKLPINDETITTKEIASLMKQV
jgi:hypothetical protein